MVQRLIEYSAMPAVSAQECDGCDGGSKESEMIGGMLWLLYKGGFRNLGLSCFEKK